MRLLVDNALSPALAALLADAGHDAVHVRSLLAAHAGHRDLRAGSWRRPCRRVCRHRLRHAIGHSFRAEAFGHPVSRPWQSQTRCAGRALLSNFAQFSEALENGSIVTLEPSRIRVRALPIGGTTNESQ